MDADDIDLGTCCACGGADRVLSILMLNYRAPIAGTGWGCAVCDLAPDGAIAVLCDDCVNHDRPLQFVVEGFLKGGGKRAPYASILDRRFDHDPAKHPECRRH